VHPLHQGRQGDEGRLRPRRRIAALPSTERPHPRSGDLDALGALEVVRRLHAEDLRACRAVGRVLPQVARAAELAADALRRGGRLIYVGAGTSGRLGALDAAECPPTFGTRPRQVVAVVAGGARALRAAVEGAEDDPRQGALRIRRLRVGERDLVCGISAGARTPFVLGALAEARRRGARTALVCCTDRPVHPAPAELVIAAATGPELVAGSTRLKAGTATKLVLNAISTAAMVGLGKVYRGRMTSLRPSNDKLRRRALRSVSELTGASAERSRRLLEASGGRVAVAVAMAFTGRPAREAAALLRRRGLRALERLR
jgi:N-acetylmuramic acid 6-phosphate etherase